MVEMVVSQQKTQVSRRAMVDATLADMRKLSLFKDDSPGMLLARAKAKPALDGLARLKNDMDGESGFSPRFLKSLNSLEQALSRLLAGDEAAFTPYDAVMRNDAFRHNMDRRLHIEIDDGRPLLSPEMVAALNTIFYMVNERKNGAIGLKFHKVVNGSESQFIRVSGANLKNLGPEVKAAVTATVELMGCGIEFSGVHVETSGSLVKITVPLKPQA